MAENSIGIEPELADRVARYGWNQGMSFERSGGKADDTHITFHGSKAVVDKLTAYRDGLKDAARPTGCWASWWKTRTPTHGQSRPRRLSA